MDTQLDLFFDNLFNRAVLDVGQLLLLRLVMVQICTRPEHLLRTKERA